jgi:outer membrane protein TolC
MTAKADLRISQLKNENAKASFWPEVTASVDYLADDEQGFGFESDRFTPYISLSQIIVNSAENSAEIREAMVNLFGAQLVAEKIKRALSFSVAKNYFALLLAQKNLKLESSLLEQSRRDLREAETKYQAGLVAQIVVLQAETNLGMAKQNLRAKYNALEQAAMALAMVIGLPATTRLRAVDVDFPELYTVTWAKCQELAMESNTELEIQEKALKKMGRYHKLTKRARWPRLSLSAFVGEDPSDPYDRDVNLGLTFTISQTLFDAGITRRRIKASEIEIKKKEAVVKDFEQRFFGELRLLFNSFNNSKMELLNSKKQCDLASRLSNVSRRGYELGTISLKDMLDSQDMTKKAEVAYATAIAMYLMAEFGLKIKMGVYQIENALDQGGKRMHEPETQKLPGASLDLKEEES